ncbi:PCYCGC domain-containing protein [Mangrovibacillus cuniculi]|uniref:Lipoprotein n=1 Tax=Mangrovibacillus cuniculi TaxID=2593652 RepID=A0A7S8CA04_9BACI|nr:PCYCGC domain-containing protein [Mangrovibacillus cuniculi]QPC46113.1 hypothetical protein G8O30_03635 [Mangrovibacillus cuniculi]
MKIAKWTKALPLAVLLVLSACSTNEASPEHTKENHGDLIEMTENRTVLPSFLEEDPPDIKRIYLGVAQYQEELEQMPCYCGCGDSVGHTSAYDCFIKSDHKNKEDIEWTDHATNCPVCLDIAAYTIIETEKGTPLDEIRKVVEEEYKEGYAEPTKTNS